MQEDTLLKLISFPSYGKCNHSLGGLKSSNVCEDFSHDPSALSGYCHLPLVFYDSGTNERQIDNYAVHFVYLTLQG